MEQQTFGFIGVGRMGGLMSARLLDGGHKVVVYDVAAEAVAALVDVQVRLDGAGGTEPVAQDAIEVEQVEDGLAGLVEDEIVEEDRDIVFAAGQMQAAAFVAGVLVVEQVVAAEHALVDVLGGEIEMVIMVPQ